MISREGARVMSLGDGRSKMSRATPIEGSRLTCSCTGTDTKEDKRARRTGHWAGFGILSAGLTICLGL